MDENHPAPEVLARHLRRELTSDESREAERHLAGCALCRRSAAALSAELRAGDREQVRGYDVAFERAAQRAGERFSQLTVELDDAVALAARLTAGPAEQREGIERPPVVRALKLCDLLLAKLREIWYDDPSALVEIAELAVAVADRLDTTHYGVNLVEDARALAWAHLANAYRIASDLRQAEEALTTAESHHRRGIEDPLTEAEILSFWASLRISQARYGEAVRLLDQALEIYKAAKDSHREGRTWIQKGMALGHAGKVTQAIRLIRKGLRSIDIEEEPQLLVAGRHNLIGYLNESGRQSEALEFLEQTRRLYLNMGNRMHLVRLRWLEGRIARELGRFADAEVALAEARKAFVDRGIGFDAALVSLDLATVYLRQGKSVEVKQLAAEMLPIFESRDVHQEALAALLVFRRAAETEEVTLSLLERLTTYLRRARRDSELRFEMAG